MLQSPAYVHHAKERLSPLHIESLMKDQVPIHAYRLEYSDSSLLQRRYGSGKRNIVLACCGMPVHLDVS